MPSCTSDLVHVRALGICLAYPLSAGMNVTSNLDVQLIVGYCPPRSWALLLRGKVSRLASNTPTQEIYLRDIHRLLMKSRSRFQIEYGVLVVRICRQSAQKQTEFYFIGQLTKKVMY
jgi:hypothetical protein